ncbi:DUF502 domain-containing protein [uncultured Ilyobacter sp.]|uniref:DUF502 domain-containing protein n=1 Tax=uncultured Ilyobacter sp. TaxID=544433 RepID=UPI0029C82065|nr:DUF502 domain-containing protein [uncultured Ilyobacter sp.]
MRKNLKNWFYTGLIALLPVILTFYFLSWIFQLVISLLRGSFVVKILTDFLLGLERFNKREQIEIYIKISVYLISIVGIFFIITLVGLTLKHVIGKRIAGFLEKLFIKLPVIKQVYTTVSQITGLVSSDKAKSYQKVVLLEYPKKGIYSLGFLTSDGNHYFEEIMGKERILNIFVPTSPNPTSGMFIMVEEKDVKILNIKVEEAVKLIISGGAIIPDSVSGRIL